jgi:hypothetical protein
MGSECNSSVEIISTFMLLFGFEFWQISLKSLEVEGEMVNPLLNIQIVTLGGSIMGDSCLPHVVIIGSIT